MGSFIARRVAEIAPERVRRLVLIGPAVTAVNEVTLAVGQLVADLDGVVPPEFAPELCPDTLHAPVPEWLFEGVRRTADLGRIAAPTPILWGEHDALFSRQDQTALLAAIPSARPVVYPDTGHCPNWERPEQVAADIEASIREAKR